MDNYGKSTSSVRLMDGTSLRVITAEIPATLSPINLRKKRKMICGARTFIPELGQHRFCTLGIGLWTNPNHDMPGVTGKINPHRSGEWVWMTRYDFIGPYLENGEFYRRDYAPFLAEGNHYFQNVCFWCDKAVPQNQVGNVLSYTPTDRDWDFGFVYECVGCNMAWATLKNWKGEAK